MTINVVSTTDAPPETGKPKESPKEPDNKSAAPKEEPKQPTASEPEGTETEGEDESEGEGQEASAKDKPKRKGGWQRRIDQKTREAADARREADVLRAELLALKGASGTQPKETAPKTNAQGEPNPDSFETHADYVRALTKWEVSESKKADQREADQKKVLTERQEIVKAYEGREKAFAKEHADYQEVLDSVSDIVASPAMIEAIVTSENGPALAYELSKNPEEFERISKLPPAAAAREMGKIEARLTPTSQSSESKPELKKTKAPKPLEPVGGKGAAVDDTDIYAPNLSQKEYERRRRKQLAQATG